MSVEELQGQLEQAARLHQEETETYTNKIRKVNIPGGFQHVRRLCVSQSPFRSRAVMYLKVMLFVAGRCQDS